MSELSPKCPLCQSEMKQIWGDTCFRCDEMGCELYANQIEPEAIAALNRRAQEPGRPLPGEGCGTIPGIGYECRCGQCLSADELIKNAQKTQAQAVSSFRQHWLEVAHERIQAGEQEAQVLRDYGYEAQAQAEPVAMQPDGYILRSDQGETIIFASSFGDFDIAEGTEIIRLYTGPQPQVQQPRMTNARHHGCEFDGWQCFHCGEVFETVGGARDHFGFDKNSDPGCRIKLGAERGLVMALRKAEMSAAEAWEKLHNESGEAVRALSAAVSRYQDQLRTMEELGYERGLRDARLEQPRAAVPDEYAILAIFGHAGLNIELGHTYSVRGQIAQLLKGARELLAAAPERQGETS